jgi:hypothetical protein
MHKHHEPPAGHNPRIGNPGSTKMVRSEFLTVTSMKMAVSWDGVPCTLLNADQHFREPYCLHRQGSSSP